MKYRSVLFVPGHEEKKIKKAYTLDADLVVIDLESTVPDNEKQNARKIIKNCKVDKKKTGVVKRLDLIKAFVFNTNEESDREAFTCHPKLKKVTQPKVFSAIINTSSMVVEKSSDKQRKHCIIRERAFLNAIQKYTV